MDNIAQQIMQYGLRAFSSANYEAAVDYFSAVLDFNDNWLCKWYLAISHYYAGHINLSRHQLMHIMDCCPEPDLQEKAKRALVTLSFSKFERTLVNSLIPMAS